MTAGVDGRIKAIPVISDEFGFVARAVVPMGDADRRALTEGDFESRWPASSTTGGVYMGCCYSSARSSRCRTSYYVYLLDYGWEDELPERFAKPADHG